MLVLNASTFGTTHWPLVTARGTTTDPAIRVASIRLRLRCRCGLRIAALGLEGYASRQTAPFVGCALQMPNGSPDHTASSLWLRPRSVSPAS